MNDLLMRYFVHPNIGLFQPDRQLSRKNEMMYRISDDSQTIVYQNDIEMSLANRLRMCLRDREDSWGIITRLEDSLLRA